MPWFLLIVNYMVIEFFSCFTNFEITRMNLLVMQLFLGNNDFGFIVLQNFLMKTIVIVNFIVFEGNTFVMISNTAAIKHLTKENSCYHWQYYQNKMKQLQVSEISLVVIQISFSRCKILTIRSTDFQTNSNISAFQAFTY